MNEYQKQILQQLREYREGQSAAQDGELCRLAIIAGKTAQGVVEDALVAFENAQRGDIEGALARLELLDEENFYKAAVALVWIETKRQQSLPRQEQCNSNIGKIVEKLDSDFSFGGWQLFGEKFMLWWLSQVQPFLDAATIEKFFTYGHDDYFDSGAQELVAQFCERLIEAKEFARARAIASILDDADVLFLLAERMFWAEQYQFVEDLLSQADNCDEDGSHYAVIFRLRIELGESLKKVREIDKALRIFVTTVENYFAYGYYNIEDVDEVVPLVVSALATYCCSRQTRHFFANLLELLAQHIDDENRYDGVVCVANLLIEQQIYDRDLWEKLIAMASEMEECYRFQADIVRELAKSGPREEVAEIAEQIFDDFSRDRLSAATMAEQKSLTTEQPALKPAADEAPQPQQQTLREQVWELIWQNAFSEAIAVACKISEQSERDMAFSQISEKMSHATQCPEKQRLFHDLWQNCRETVSEYVVANIAKGVSKAPDIPVAEKEKFFALAKQTSQQLSEKGSIFKEIAIGYAYSGNFTAACEAMEQIVVEQGAIGPQSQAAQVIAELQARAGRFHEALATSKYINQYERHKTLAALFIHIAQAETPSLALLVETLEFAEPKGQDIVREDRDKYLLARAYMLAQNGAFSQVLEIAAQEREIQYYIHCILVEAMAQSGELQQALAKVDEIRWPGDSYKALSVKKVIEASLLSEPELSQLQAIFLALKKCYEIETPGYRDKGLREIFNDIANLVEPPPISDRQPCVPLLERACSMVSETSASAEKCQALAIIARFMDLWGEHTKAEALWREAIEIAGSLSFTAFPKALPYLAEHLASSDTLDNKASLLEDYLQNIHHYDEVDSLLPLIARITDHKRQLQLWVKTIERVSRFYDIYYQSHALSQIAAYVAKLDIAHHELLPYAEKIVENIENANSFDYQRGGHHKEKYLPVTISSAAVLASPPQQQQLFNTAFAKLQEIASYADYPYILEKVIENQLHAGLISEAFDSLGKFREKDIHSKCASLSLVAVSLLMPAQVEQAEQLFMEAVQLARHITGGRWQTLAQRIGQSNIPRRRQLLQQLLENALHIRTEWDRYETLCNLVSDFARLGEYQIASQFLENQVALSQQHMQRIATTWQQALVQQTPPPLAAIRHSLSLFPFDGFASYHGVIALRLAHLWAGNQQYCAAIDAAAERNW